MLRIEKLTEGMEMSKTAEEQEMEKIAHVVNVIDQAQTLTAVGEELYKIASEIESEPLQALAADLYETGTRMGACLTKTASESDETLGEALEIAEDLNKLASILAEVADEANEEGLNKMAEAVISISNEMTEEANEVFEKLAMLDPTQPMGEPMTERQKAAQIKAPEYKHNAKGAPLDPAEGTADSTKSKHPKADKAMHHLRSFYGKEAWKATHARDIYNKAEGNIGAKLKALLGTKAGLKALSRPGVAYGTAAAALLGAGYGAKKMREK